MKKILILLVAFLATTSMNAQLINVTKDGKVIATYKGSQVDEVVYESKSNTPTGTAMRTGKIAVNWVQLWENGPRFAEYNVGAANNKPEDLGGDYSWGSSLDCGNRDCYTGTDIRLTGDNDTATKLWGANWRMPTKDELQALLDNCDATWYDGYRTKYNNTDVRGYLFTGRGAYSTNSMFLPATTRYWDGWDRDWVFYGNLKYECNYWSSDKDSPSSKNAYHLKTSEAGFSYIYREYEIGFSYIYRGYQVRAVYAW